MIVVPHFPYKINRDVRSRVGHYPSYDVRGQTSPSVIRPLTSPFIIELSFSTHSGFVYIFKVMHCSVILFVNKHEQGKLIDVSQRISWTSLKNVKSNKKREFVVRERERDNTFIRYERTEYHDFFSLAKIIFNSATPRQILLVLTE